MDMEEFYLVVAYILAGVLGLCVGSFLNVVIYRLPRKMSLSRPGSHCTHCSYALRWYDNIPLVSYLILGGRCRSCKTHISFRYTAVELANTCLWLLSVFLFWERSIPFALLCAFASTIFICIFFIDLEHKIIYDRFQLMLLVLGVAALFLDPDFGWLSHLIGGISGFFVFYAVAVVFEKLCKTEALGGGDIKLAGVAGLMLGWERLLLALLLACLPAAVILLILRHRSTARDEEDEEAARYPFAPFLVSGFALAMFFGTPIIDGYLSLLGL